MCFYSIPCNLFFIFGYLLDETRYRSRQADLPMSFSVFLIDTVQGLNTL